jgi:hypothetical protein
MPKFKKEKKVVRKQVGGYPLGAVQQRGSGAGASLLPFVLPGGYPVGAIPGGSRNIPVAAPESSSPDSLDEWEIAEYMKGLPASAIPGSGRVRKPEAPKKQSSSASRSSNLSVQSGQVLPKGMQASMADLGLSGISSMLSGAPAVDPLAGLPSKKLPSMTSGMRVEMPEGEEQELESLKKTGGASSAAAAIPKTKAGMKKFMQDYGKFIALGAMAGAGGKGGQIAAPIIAALPGLIEMMKGKGKAAATPAPKAPAKDAGNYKKGGAIRKFKGGSMDKSKGNTKDSMFTPKYKKGGSMGEMPQHKKMAMGKPTPQSTGQKFAKGGTMKCATGGVPKGYGIAKKIRQTGPMN